MTMWTKLRSHGVFIVALPYPASCRDVVRIYLLQPKVRGLFFRGPFDYGTLCCRPQILSIPKIVLSMYAKTRLLAYRNCCVPTRTYTNKLSHIALIDEKPGDHTLLQGLSLGIIAP